ncbi:patatin-like phospholipase family protein [Nocardia sp. CDC159]|uniref:Patatin-like phospholipase family protein n=1 Tax=Nocardia pulmonis TaxID=2951408 RepID=A0A9X2IUS6_9NOCA|nr:MULTISPECIES: patatin-like phospholipase family protein [Nocardia]MCM6772448.1 patatin-like phospholipase family protein [Nocardia pulmonis]MCM6784894.1 patatin-like phospholipase family protein [Nocardia sp. CDC159]
MSEPLSPKVSRIALVLGGGGPVGVAWLAGLAGELRRQGVDLGAADRLVGTSAGAIVAAVLADGGDPVAVLTLGAATASEPAVAMDMAVFAPLREPGLDLAAARRKVGELAMAARAGDAGEQVARMEAMLGMTQWPRRDLVITAVEVASGRLRGWTRADEASLAQAVAASTAVPGMFAPVPIAGGHYIDGGIGSPINAHLAAGADLVVIVEPLAHMFGHLPSDGDLAGATAVSIVPDTMSIAAFGPDVFNPAALAPAYESGVRQAVDAAKILADSGWPTH